MGNYRKLWIINSLGNKYDLTDDNSKGFLNTPNGFGFNRVYSSQQIGNSEIVISQQFQLTDISGELLFYNGDNGNKYQAYQDFIQFVKYKPLELHYQTPNELDSYYSEVLFTQVDKSEVSEDGILRLNVVFHRLTQWLTDKDYTIKLTNTPIDDGKYYELVRPYHYAGTNLSNTPITNNGTDDIGFIITIEGGTNGVQNPTFSLTQEGDTYGICKINGTYDYVQINSVENVEDMYLERNGATITNPEQYQDFTIANGSSYITWCKLRVGTSIFNFTCGNIDTFDGTITISFKNSFVSV